MNIKITISVLLVLGMFTSISSANAQTTMQETENTENNIQMMFEQAQEHFELGEYKQVIKICDNVLKFVPQNVSVLKIKGIAQSNLGLYKESLEQFYKILQFDPDDIHALTGMGLSLGYLGEYEESKKHFEKALELKPKNTVLENYNEYIDRVIVKYPYTATEKPEQLVIRENMTKIPSWIKNNAKWWSEGHTSDLEFVSMIEYLIRNEIVKISREATHTPSLEIQSLAPALESPPVLESPTSTNQQIPTWIRDNARLWSEDMVDDITFGDGIQYMIGNKIIQKQTTPSSEESQKELDNKLFYFKQYIHSISRNVSEEKRYIELPNPSQDVIKKFLRDYIKWNFEAEVKGASTNFPNPKYETIDDTTTIYYAMFVNEQPSGLPLDHVSTLKESIGFWEGQELTSAEGHKVKIKFSFTNLRHEANVWVTWVVRDLGEGVLGHANIGKGVVEITLGDYNCDGSFQLYDVNSVEYIMRHELGHSVGLLHDKENKDSIMYPAYSPEYAYCLLR